MKRYDLHTHTRASFDCRTDWEQYVLAVVAARLDGVAITDHDTIDGALRLRDRRPPFDVIVGCEFTLDTGAHLIGLHLERPLRASSLFETAMAIREQGGIVILPHPFRPVTGALSLCPNEADCGSILGRVDAIEAFNAKSSWHENKRSLELAGRMQMPVTAGSDAHRVTEIGSGIMRAPSDFRDGGLGTVSGVDQTNTALQIRRRSREQLRGHALFLKRAIPEPVWRAGKRAWTTWLDHVDAGVPMPMREYGSFPSVIRAPVQQEHIHSTSGEHQ